MSEVKKCPKCGGEMFGKNLTSRVAEYIGAFRAAKGAVFGDSVTIYQCEKCGYAETTRIKQGMEDVKS